VVLVVFALALLVILPALKTHLGGTIATFRKFSRSSLSFDRSAAFSAVLLLVIAVAFYFSIGWLPAASFVPRAACYAALFFVGLNLMTEIFGQGQADRPSAFVKELAQEQAVLVEREPPPPLAVFRKRALRFFGWLVGFLVLAAFIGMLPSLFVFAFLQMRLEFGERWRFALGGSVIATVLVWALFDRVFSLPWPQAYLGDWFPALRDMTGLI
jgi:Tripartite tricarboxylate transporter TctB family